MHKRIYITLLGLFLLYGAESYASDRLKPKIDELKLLDQVFLQIESDLIQSLKQIPPAKLSDKEGRKLDGIGILPIQNDSDERFYNLLRKVLTRSDFFVYEKKEVESLLQNQKFQNQDFYKKEDRLRIGNLTQWKGMVFGKSDTYVESFLGKRKVYVTIDFSFENIETGQVIWQEKLTHSINVELAKHWYYLGMGILVILAFLYNNKTQGRKVSVILISLILAGTAFSAWFYLI